MLGLQRQHLLRHSHSSSPCRSAHSCSSHIHTARQLTLHRICCGAGKRPGRPSSAADSEGAGKKKHSSKQSKQNGGFDPHADGANEPRSALHSMITLRIKDIRNDSFTGLQELEDVVDQWGSSLGYIQVSAAFVKAANLRTLQPAAAKPVLTQLAGMWGSVLPDAEPRQLANVMWACGKLRFDNPWLWSNTLNTFREQLQRGEQLNSIDIANVLHGFANAAAAGKHGVPGLAPAELEAAVCQLGERMRVLVTHPLLEGVEPRHISNTLWACAKLRINPGDAVLNSLLRVTSGTDMVKKAEPQHLSNLLWAVSELQQRVGWQPDMEQRAWQRLLGEQQVSKAAASNPQVVSNIVLALARLNSAALPVIAQEIAQQLVEQLLQGPVAQRLERWNAQDIGNAVWACAKLGVVQSKFLQGVELAAAAWVPRAAAPSIQQLAYAYGALQLQQPQLLGQLTARAQQLLSPQGAGKGRASQISALDAISVPAVLGWAVATSDAQQLAGDVHGLVARGLEQSSKRNITIKGDVGRSLWMLHSWLVQHQLLDGRGLVGVLTEEQLAACQTEAAAV